MLIGCLGWGSLIWDPRSLPTRGPWFADGPFLPIEFVRQSEDNRITLVLVPDKALVRSLWTILDVGSWEQAREELGKREGIKPENCSKYVGIWPDGQPRNDETTKRIGVWAKSANLDAVVWTNLPPKFKGKDKDDQIPTAEEVVSYLSALRGPARDNAERYVRMAPPQIDTDYRRHIQAALH
jgi:hypothetical protein